MDDDNELVRRTLRGEKRAFEMIIRKYEQPILNYIGRMVGERETASDFSQEVFLKVYASLSSFRPQFKFSTWIFKIASNYLIDHWRKRKLPTVSLDHPAGGGEDNQPLQVACAEPSVVRKLEMAELRKRIETALEKIPLHLKELFIWRHVNGLSYEEMAEIKSIPIGTIKNRVFLAKEMIRRIIEEEA